MTETIIISNKYRRTLAKKAVKIIEDSIQRLLLQKEYVVLGICGGRSVKEIFDIFRTTTNIPWKKVHIFLVDERLVEKTSRHSNYKNAYDLFLSKLLEEKKLPAENAHPFELDIFAKDKGLEKYNEEFKKFQPFDIVLLGAGEDGHVAALFPQHHSIRHEGEEYFTMPDSPKPPVERLTASRKMLEGADTAIALFLGEGKRQAFQNFKNPELSTPECPAKLIRNAAYPYVLTDNIERIKPFTLVIFGGTGDLARRKLAPAIISLVKKRAIPMDFSIVGIGRRPLSDEEYKKHLLEFDTLNQNIWNDINIRYFQIDMSMPNALEGFEEYLLKSAKTSGNRIYYLATSNNVVGNVIDQLKKYNLHKHPEYFRRIVFEKPFGDCLESSVWLDRKARNVFPEESIYRLDHYLGKYAVQNILAFRFSNPLFEYVWNNKSIEQINILVDEELGAGNRIAYYDTAGAIKDMVQNHLLQILSLILMNAPKNLEEKSISNEKVKALKAVDISSSKNIVVGQYEEYMEEAREAGITKTNTETFVEVKLSCNNKRWRGTPIVLRTGKCLIKRRACIEIIFKQQSDEHKCLYPSAKPNTLFINIQPTKNISFRLNLKNQKGTFASYLMEHSHARSFGSRDTGTYERLIADCIRGDKILFSRYDVLKTSWKITDKILKLKENIALVKYREGSHGPKGFYEY